MPHMSQRTIEFEIHPIKTNIMELLSILFEIGIGQGLAGLGAGAAAIGAGIGVGRIGGSALEAMARQP